MGWFDEKWGEWMTLLLTGFAGMDEHMAFRVVRFQKKFIRGLNQLIIGVLMFLLFMYFREKYGFEWVVTVLLLGCSLILGRIYGAVKKEDV